MLKYFFSLCTVNTPCIGDILPCHMKFINKKHVVNASNTICHFVHERILNPRLAQKKANKMKSPNREVDRPIDLLDAFLKATETSPDLTMNQAIFVIEACWMVTRPFLAPSSACLSIWRRTPQFETKFEMKFVKIVPAFHQSPLNCPSLNPLRGNA